MKRTGTICVLLVSVMLAACGANDTCEEPEFYESATGGKRIIVPDGLDGLSASREMVIPEASPRSPRDRSEGCLDRPPVLRTE